MDSQISLYRLRWHQPEIRSNVWVSDKKPLLGPAHSMGRCCGLLLFFKILKLWEDHLGPTITGSKNHESDQQLVRFGF